MALTTTQFRYYDHNVLRLPGDKRVEYNAQVDRLIKKLTDKLHETTSLRVARVIKAGSFSKHTILRKAPGVSVDVDVAFYIQDRNADTENFKSLSDQIYGFLIALYPTKEVGDFKIGKRAATVTFVGTGLDVDVVPVVDIPDSGGYGWQFGTDGSRVKTCVPCQLEFIKARKRTDSDFRTLVRLAKQWRNHNNAPGLKSYAIELIMAYLLDENGTAGTVEERFRQFLLYIAQSELSDVISFPENSLPLGKFAEPVVIVDPVNSSNNVAARVESSEKLAIQAQARESWEAAHFASLEDELSLWKEVFGPRFRIEE